MGSSPRKRLRGGAGALGQPAHARGGLLGRGVGADQAVCCPVAAILVPASTTLSSNECSAPIQGK